MVDIIIVLIVIVLLGLALKGSIKHFKGEGPCCGGGGGSVVLDIPDKKSTVSEDQGHYDNICKHISHPF